MNRCEWVKGKVINSEGDHRLKFYPCEDASIFLGPHDEYYRDTMSVNNGIKLKNNYCSFCGADIRKPEPKYCNSECGMRMKYGVSCDKHDCKYLKIGTQLERPITKIVNGVEVARYKGMDYVRLGNLSGYAPFLLNVNGKDQINACWKPMTEIQKAIYGSVEARPDTTYLDTVEGHEAKQKAGEANRG